MLPGKDDEVFENSPNTPYSIDSDHEDWGGRTPEPHDDEAVETVSLIN